VSSSVLRALRNQAKSAPFLVRRNRHRAEKDKAELGKGVAAGLIGGLVGTIVMTAFQNGWSKASTALKGNQSGREQGDGGQSEESEDATMKAVKSTAVQTPRTSFIPLTACTVCRMQLSGTQKWYPADRQRERLSQ
jgi:hypothetical protein